MKKIILKKKIVKKNRNKVKRGSIRLVRRAEVPTYKELAAREKDPYKLLKDLYFYRDKPDSERYQTNIKNLLRLGLTPEDIKAEFKMILNGHKIKHDLGLFYRGEKEADDLIKSWKDHGLQTESDVKVAAITQINPWETPLNKNDYKSNLVNRENVVHKQLDLIVNLPLYRAYLSEVVDRANRAVRNGKMSIEEAIRFKKYGLLNLAEVRPEYAAVIYYMYNGGDIHDRNINIDKIISAYRRGSAEFNFQMNEYRLNRSRGNIDPEYQLARKVMFEKIHDKKEQAIRDYFNKKEYKSKSNKYKSEVDGEIVRYNNKGLIVGDKDEGIYNVILNKPAKDLTSHSDLWGEGESERRKRKMITPKRKLIKKKIVKRCRCK